MEIYHHHPNISHLSTISSGLVEEYRAIDFVRDFVATVDFGLFGDYPYDFEVVS